MIDFGEQRVGADDDVDLALGEAFLGLLRLGRRDQPRQPADLDREALEAARRNSVNAGGRAGSSGRPARPASPDMAATKAARSATSVLPKPTSPHTSRSIGLPDCQVGEHFLDRAVLVVGLLIGEAVDELREGGSGSATAPGRVARSAAVLISSPAISRMRSFIRDLRRCQASPPSRSRADALAVAAVAGQDVDILDRHVELVAAGIFQRDAVVRRLADLDRGQPLVAADAMVGMDDEVARGERRQLGKEGVGALARFLRRRTSRSPSMSCSVRTATSSLVKPWSSGRTISAASVLAPSASCQLSASFSDLEAMVFEQAGEPLARAPACSWPARPSACFSVAWRHARRLLRRYWPAARARARSRAPARLRSR